MFNEGTGALPYVLSRQIKTYVVLAKTRWFRGTGQARAEPMSL
jgi:hypothetical protein